MSTATKDEAATAAVGFLLFLPFSIVTTGLLGRWIWNMVVPDVLGGPSIGIIDAFGVALLVDFFTYRPTGGDHRSFAELVGAAVSLKVIFTLLFFVYWVIR